MNAENFLARFFGVFIQRRTYLNLLYLALAFPLGLFYFIFLVVGLSVGLSLIIIWVGLLILPVVFAGWWAFAAFERQMAIGLLNVKIPPMTRAEPPKAKWSDKAAAYLTNPVTWKSLAYLFLKFPLGTFSFVVLVTLAALTGTFLAAPVIYPFIEPQVWFTWNSVWQIDTLNEALVAFFIGVGLLFVSLHTFNGLAWVSGQLARLMLGDFRPPLPAADARET